MIRYSFLLTMRCQEVVFVSVVPVIIIGLLSLIIVLSLFRFIDFVLGALEAMSKYFERLQKENDKCNQVNQE